MNLNPKFIYLFSALITVLSTGCLVKETVTVNGEVMQEDYKIKRPIEDVIDNSQ